VIDLDPGGDTFADAVVVTKETRRSCIDSLYDVSRFCGPVFSAVKGHPIPKRM
jgi:hypothetical protein